MARCLGRWLRRTPRYSGNGFAWVAYDEGISTGEAYTSSTGAGVSALWQLTMAWESLW